MNIKELNNVNNKELKRRDFLGLTAIFMSIMGVFSFIYPFIKSLGPSAEVVAQSTIEVDLLEIKEGKTKVVKWQGKPVFIRKRSKEEIKKAQLTNIKDLRDPQTDQQRTHVGKEEWLILVGICTHLGCVPVEVESEEKGWFCPCHGSKYDISGRIISGPAPLNLPVPDYYFSSNNTIVIGKKNNDVV
ncbi:ubiquinol-cytochrome c reductase iron-sulfur subunit [Neoehrlichia mikurensis]|uniref:Ubiquinol-cytochrome c reductase iron-sulfur subunit n=1 Tax=Neoehrlichia mikurensis TaxID=89586 RepID=A0A9Q9F3U4_9RICK|nr:ubiquinol-cytochrome c reductase iron-sulfur subunit [Neoehrlichia mikurensis]QXK91882.1 ubiquinol-cytochrome c reductase iron-sulfur subunit [Neoehrlichia mikurensis]QXK93095.1 ubiquinol-cytochrome c reductase iron-sulfur subunit [Neoehrlichia mikurensis]QXK93575.1 ubiquinol-cytochrome c reductase iron-sulfur subunit [Neoehrlichia mikurensis]UTO55472.1 ubiquinol-cytochrome c reductase iron-sulfur subunit [Neoehrlichia mikurensis]UTO56392.1 ubiquinol-cytochrome c reductase iron-sulfur subun